ILVEQMLSTVTEQGGGSFDEIGYFMEDQGNYQLISFDKHFWGFQPVAELNISEASTATSSTTVDEELTEETATIAAEEGAEEVRETRSTWWIWAIAAFILFTIAGIYAWNFQSKSEP